MSANVETMMYRFQDARDVPWHGLGNPIPKTIIKSDEALVAGGIDWTVEQIPLALADGTPVEDYFANVRDRDRSVLGIVTGRYRIVQNSAAFRFLDNLIGPEITYETAGALDGGKRVFIAAKMPQTSVLGDHVDTFLVFTNSFDATSALTVFLTKIRVVCSNTLNLALRGASCSWSLRHTESIEGRLHEAQTVLANAAKYSAAFEGRAEELSRIKVSTDATMKLIDELYGDPMHSADKATQEYLLGIRGQFLQCLAAPDLANHKGTAWGVLNAVSDLVSHAKPRRERSGWQGRRMVRLIEGDAVLAQAEKILSKVA